MENTRPQGRGADRYKWLAEGAHEDGPSYVAQNRVVQQLSLVSTQECRLVAPRRSEGR